MARTEPFWPPYRDPRSKAAIGPGELAEPQRTHDTYSGRTIAEELSGRYSKSHAPPDDIRDRAFTSSSGTA
jgi:hypothetical protein